MDLKLFKLQLETQINSATAIWGLFSSTFQPIWVTINISVFLNPSLYQTTAIREIVLNKYRQKLNTLKSINVSRTLKNKFLQHCAGKLKQEMFVLPIKIGWMCLSSLCFDVLIFQQFYRPPLRSLMKCHVLLITINMSNEIKN